MSVVLVTHDLGVVAQTCDRAGGDVCRPRRRDRPGHGDLPPAAPCLHARAAELGAARRRAAPAAGARFAGQPPRLSDRAARLRLRAALPLRDRRTAARRRRRWSSIAPAHRVGLPACIARSARDERPRRSPRRSSRSRTCHELSAAALADRSGCRGRPASVIHALNGVSFDRARAARRWASSANPAAASRRSRAASSGCMSPTAGAIGYDGTGRADASRGSAARLSTAACRWSSRIPTARSTRA